jgi:16S rRNA (uracil1498-N3)-methyltransferase
LKAKLASHYRFYVPDGIPDGQERVRFSKAESRHMISSLRVREGDLVTATDGRGEVYSLAVESTHGREVTAALRAVECVERDGPAVDLFQAAVKPARMELIVEKATELGLWRFIPVVSSRSEKTLGEVKMERLRKAAVEAMKQSLGAYLPEVTGPVRFDEALAMPDAYDTVLVAWEGEEARPLSRVLEGCQGGRIALWIGPAGGFAEHEVAMLMDLGALTFTLGHRRLTSETAAIASLAVLRHVLTF